MSQEIGRAALVLTVEDQELRSGIRQAKAETEAALRGIKPARVKVEADARGAKAEAEAALKSIKPARVKVEADTAQARQELAGLERTVARVKQAVAGGIAVEGLGGIAQSGATSEQALFAVRKAYRETADEWVAYSKQMQDATAASDEAVQQSAVGMNTLTRNYGANADQIKNLIQLSADLGAIKGYHLVDASGRITAAMYGEAESAEQLNLRLSETAMAEYARAKGIQSSWEKLGEAEKFQLRYAKAIEDGAFAEGAAAEQRELASGQMQVFKNRIQDLTSSLGDQLGPAQAVAGILPDIAMGLGGAGLAVEAGVKGIRKLKDALKELPAKATVNVGVEVAGEAAGAAVGEAAGAAGAEAARRGLLARLLAKLGLGGLTARGVGLVSGGAGLAIGIPLTIKYLVDEEVIPTPTAEQNAPIDKMVRDRAGAYPGYHTPPDAQRPQADWRAGYYDPRIVSEQQRQLERTTGLEREAVAATREHIDAFGAYKQAVDSQRDSLEKYQATLVANERSVANAARDRMLRQETMIALAQPADAGGVTPSGAPARGLTEDFERTAALRTLAEAIGVADKELDAFVAKGRNAADLFGDAWVANAGRVSKALVDLRGRNEALQADAGALQGYIGQIDEIIERRKEAFVEDYTRDERARYEELTAAIQPYLDKLRLVSEARSEAQGRIGLLEEAVRREAEGAYRPRIDRAERDLDAERSNQGDIQREMELNQREQSRLNALIEKENELREETRELRTQREVEPLERQYADVQHRMEEQQSLAEGLARRERKINDTIQERKRLLDELKERLVEQRVEPVERQLRSVQASQEAYQRQAQDYALWEREINETIARRKELLQELGEELTRQRVSPLEAQLGQIEARQERFSRLAEDHRAREADINAEIEDRKRLLDELQEKLTRERVAPLEAGLEAVESRQRRFGRLAEDQGRREADINRTIAQRRELLEQLEERLTRQQVGPLERQLEAVEARQEKWSRIAEDLRERESDINRVIEERKRLLEAAQEAAMRRQVAPLQRELEATEALSERLQGQIEAVDEQREALEGRMLGGLRERVEEANRDLQPYRDRLSDLKDRQGELSESLQTLNERIDTYRERALEAALASRSALSPEFNTLGEEAAALEARLQGALGKLGEITSRASRMSSGAARVTDEIERLKALGEEIPKYLLDAQTYAEAEAERLGAMEPRLTAEAILAERDNQRVQGEVQAATRGIGDAPDSLLAQRDRVESELARVSRIEELLGRQVKQREDRARRLQRQLDAAVRRWEAADERLLGRRSGLETQLAGAQDRAKELRAEIDRATKAIERRFEKGPEARALAALERQSRALSRASENAQRRIRQEQRESERLRELVEATTRAIQKRIENGREAREIRALERQSRAASRASEVAQRNMQREQRRAEDLKLAIDRTTAAIERRIEAGSEARAIRGLERRARAAAQASESAQRSMQREQRRAEDLKGVIEATTRAIQRRLDTGPEARNIRRLEGNARAMSERSQEAQRNMQLEQRRAEELKGRIDELLSSIEERVENGPEARAIERLEAYQRSVGDAASRAQDSLRDTQAEADDLRERIDETKAAIDRQFEEGMSAQRVRTWEGRVGRLQDSLRPLQERLWRSQDNAAKLEGHLADLTDEMEAYKGSPALQKALSDLRITEEKLAGQQLQATLDLMAREGPWKAAGRNLEVATAAAERIWAVPPALAEAKKALQGALDRVYEKLEDLLPKLADYELATRDYKEAIEELERIRLSEKRVKVSIDDHAYLEEFKQRQRDKLNSKTAKLLADPGRKGWRGTFQHEYMEAQSLKLRPKTAQFLGDRGSLNRGGTFQHEYMEVQSLKFRDKTAHFFGDKGSPNQRGSFAREYADAQALKFRPKTADFLGDWGGRREAGSFQHEYMEAEALKFRDKTISFLGDPGDYAVAAISVISGMGAILPPTDDGALGLYKWLNVLPGQEKVLAFKGDAADVLKKRKQLEDAPPVRQTVAFEPEVRKNGAFDKWWGRQMQRVEDMVRNVGADGGANPGGYPSHIQGSGYNAATQGLVPGGEIISGWGEDRDSGARKHEGVDIAARRGTPIYAIAPGVVTHSEYNTLGGHSVSYRDNLGRRWYFAHFDEPSTLDVGDRIEVGTMIGRVGTSGNARGTPPHLHYQVSDRSGEWANPAQVLRSWEAPARMVGDRGGGDERIPGYPGVSVARLGQRMNQMLAGSGLRGLGDEIARYADHYDIPPDLTLAMLRQETSWMSRANTVSWRNFNPGNLRWADWEREHGGRPGYRNFTRFPSLSHGLAAQSHLLDRSYRSYIDRKDWRGLVYKYAPPSDNGGTAFPNLYAQHLRQWMPQYKRQLLAGGGGGGGGNPTKLDHGGAIDRLIVGRDPASGRRFTLGEDAPHWPEIVIPSHPTKLDAFIRKLPRQRDRDPSLVLGGPLRDRQRWEAIARGMERRAARPRGVEVEDSLQRVLDRSLRGRMPLGRTPLEIGGGVGVGLPVREARRDEGRAGRSRDTRRPYVVMALDEWAEQHGQEDMEPWEYLDSVRHARKNRRLR